MSEQRWTLTCSDGSAFSGNGSASLGTQLSSLSPRSCTTRWLAASTSESHTHAHTLPPPADEADPCELTSGKLVLAVLLGLSVCSVL
jgi:hypothetical protein